MADSDELSWLRGEVQRLRLALTERERQLYHSKRLAALGMLVAGIAHEIRTPIAAVGSTQDTLQRATEKLKATLERECPELCQNDRGVRSALAALDSACKVIRSGSVRTLEIIRNIRKLARQDDDVMQETDLHAEIDDTLLLLHHELKDRITVERRYGELPRVVCNAGQVSQVLLNVLINAIQAIEDRGTITIETAADRGLVRLKITDTGKGVPPELMSRIFEPGFSTKEPGQGTGLGLSICKEIVERHGGDLELESEPGRGTTVTITLSVSPGAS